jgi:hypothetical protein
MKELDELRKEVLQEDADERPVVVPAQIAAPRMFTATPERDEEEDLRRFEASLAM